MKHRSEPFVALTVCLFVVVFGCIASACTAAQLAADLPKVEQAGIGALEALCPVLFSLAGQPTLCVPVDTLLQAVDAASLTASRKASASKVGAAEVYAELVRLGAKPVPAAKGAP